MESYEWISIISAVLVVILAVWTIVEKIRRSGRSATGKDISISSYGTRISKIESAAQVIPTLNQIRDVVETHKDLMSIFAEDFLLLLDKHRLDDEKSMEQKYQELIKFMAERIRKQ